MKNQAVPYRLITYVGLSFLGLMLLGIFKPFTIIKAGERGVIMSFGKVKEAILDEGIKKWDGRFPTVMGGDGALPFINIDPQQVNK